MKRCFTFFLVIVVLFLVACNSVQEQATQQEPSEQDALAQARARVGSWNCETGEGGLEWDIAPSKDECYFDKAVILEDQTFCDKIIEFGKEECLAAMKDCELLLTTTEKDQCYEQKMQARINPTSSFFLGGEYLAKYCIQINDVTTKDSCWIYIASFFGEPALCEKVSGTSESPYAGMLTKSACYAAIAQGPNPANFDVCDKIVLGEADQSQCWLNIMRSRVACVTDNFPTEVNGYPTTCGLNENDKRINPTERRAIATGDEKLCASIPEKMSKEGCYALVAIKKLNPSICNQVDTPINKRECLNFVSLAKKDATICELQELSEDKNWCYDTYGRTNLDQTACNNIKGNDNMIIFTKDECFNSISKKTQDSSICDQTTNKDYCYYLIVSTPGNKKDPSLCQKIMKDMTLKEDCQRILQEG